jgi:amino-acid racemase
VKTLGLLGGMSWQSTVPYYQLINQRVAERLGGYHSARLLLFSVDFADVERRMHAGQWDEAGELLADAARRLEKAGADLIVLCTNTLHRVAPTIERALGVPFLHVVDVTAQAIAAARVGRVGLLATRFTMEDGFYVERLDARGVQVVVPGPAEREVLHRVIFDELVHGRVSESARRTVRELALQLVRSGAGGVILGCTELGMVLSSADVPFPVFDTTVLHARAAADRALED